MKQHKITRLIVSLLMVICVGILGNLTVYAEDKSFLNVENFENLIFDYKYLTRVDDDTASNYYSILQNDGLTQEVEEKVEQLLPDEILNSSSGEQQKYVNTLYIQDNYNDIIRANDNKQDIDIYILFYSLKFRDYTLKSSYQNKSPAIYDVTPELSGYDNGDYIEDPNEPKLGPLERETAVASLRVFALDAICDKASSLPDLSDIQESVFGCHAWITIENITNSKLKVGAFTISPGKGLSFGNWGNQKEYVGLWYNLEEYFYAQGYYNGRVSLKANISQTQLDRLNKYISTSDYYSLRGFNCASFASGAWNSISTMKISAGSLPTPKNLARSINEQSIAYTNAHMSYDYSVYYNVNNPKRSTKY